MELTVIADFNEMASQHEEMTRQVDLQNHYAKVEQPPADWDKVHCVDELCGLPIDPLRLAHGFFRCFECQSAKEVKLKRMKG